MTNCAPQRLFSVRPNLSLRDLVIFSLSHTYASKLSITYLLSGVLTGVSFCHAVSILCLLDLYCTSLVFSMSFVSAVNMSLK